MYAGLLGSLPACIIKGLPSDRTGLIHNIHCFAVHVKALHMGMELYALQSFAKRLLQDSLYSLFLLEKQWPFRLRSGKLLTYFNHIIVQLTGNTRPVRILQGNNVPDTAGQEVSQDLGRCGAYPYCPCELIKPLPDQLKNRIREYVYMGIYDEW